MSYDYNKLVSDIQQSRAKDPQTAVDIEETLNHFSNLSTKCPMTPLLWMQYAYDAGRVLTLLNTEGSIDVTCQVLELGLAEFPGCAMLRLYHFDCVIARCQQNGYNDNDQNQVKSIWNDLLNSICLGCHGGYDESIVVALFNLYTTRHLLQGQNTTESVVQTFLQRAKLFMKKENDSLRSELSHLSEEFGFIISDSDYETLDSNRQLTSQHWSFLNDLEDDILISMEADGISSSPDLSDFASDQCNGTFYDWHRLLMKMEKQVTYLMGYGMTNVSTSIIKYTKALVKHKRYISKLIKETLSEENETASSDQEEKMYLQTQLQLLDRMIFEVYERGVSECPTVENIWEKYLNHIFYVLHEVKEDEEQVMSIDQILSHAKSVASRAVRNCPYSVNLFRLKMSVIQEEVYAGKKVLDPDELSTIVNEAISWKFLPSPESNLKLHFAAMSVVKQRILQLVSKGTSTMNFDEVDQPIENCGKKRKRNESSLSTFNFYNSTLNEKDGQEVQDLIDDLRELYDILDEFVKDTYKDLTTLREVVHRERANDEAYICLPLLASSNYLEEALKNYEKIFKNNQSVHPDSWKCYIRFAMGSNLWDKFVHKNDDALPTGGPAAKFRFVRSLYCRSMVINKKEKQAKNSPTLFGEDYSFATKSLCNDFLEFENNFGSSKSKNAARRMVDDKLAFIGYELYQQHLLNVPSTEHSQLTPDSKVKTEVNTNENQSKANKVVIGKLEYPAHPFTIHVSNLSPETEDMDLHDLFRAKCGPIVHCRIFREKNDRDRSHRPKSKCSGLIQFEERESVESALKLNGEVGIHEKLIKVDRSHQPAVGIIPPGLHRIQPKGEGKHTKRNQKRKERRNKEEKQSQEQNQNLILQKETHVSNNIQNPTISSPEKAKVISNKSSSSVLAFRPRGVRQKKPKTKVAISK